MERLVESLALFAPISLSDMAGVALLDRIDTKYVLTREQLWAMLPALRSHYRVLEVDGRRQSAYRTLYFDTSAFDLYRSHQDGRRVRYKVRSRAYVGTPLAFLEVKHKTGRNHTTKERLATPCLVTELNGEVTDFLHGRISLSPDELQPTLWIDYSRITLVGRTAHERLTIDIDLQYSIDGRLLALPGLAIAELKSEGRPRMSPAVRLMREQRIRPGSFSKYCVGASLLYPELKHNRFSHLLRRIEQLNHAPQRGH